MKPTLAKFPEKDLKTDEPQYETDSDSDSDGDMEAQPDPAPPVYTRAGRKVQAIERYGY